MPTAKRAISSRVTIQNPRPRKYASAAERQKALRERFPTLCVRVEQEQADFMKRIADEQGRTLQDVHLAFIKYANGRGNLWLTQGLKGFAPLPRFEEPPKENPMKRKPTPAQIAARERFAEMARSGAFKKKARKKNPMVISKQADESLSKQGSRGYVRKLLDRYSDEGHVVSVKKTRSGSIGIAFDGGRMLTVASARKKLEDYYGITDTMKRRSNPRKKTVSEKISQLSREGYPQKQAVAIALSEERAGKVKRNPMQFYEVINTVTGESEGIVKAADYMLAFDVFARKNGYKNFAEMKQKEKLASNEYLMTEIKRRSNPRASNPIVLVTDSKPSKRKANPVKRKDMTVYQVQYRKPGMKLFEPWMTVMYPKMAEDIARRLADEPMAQTWTIKVESIKVKG